MADLKNLLRQEAAEWEIATELVIKEKLLEMVARLEALAVEDHNGEQ